MSRFLAYTALVLATVLGAVTVAADSLTIIGPDNVAHEIDFDDLRDIRFRGDSMYVSTFSGERLSFHMDEIQAIEKEGTTTDIDAPTISDLKANSDVKFALDGRKLTITTTSGAAVDATLFNPTGFRALHAVGPSGLSIDLTPLPHRVYIVAVGSAACKIIL